MGLLDTYSANLFYGFFNEKIADAFTGPIWRLSKAGTTGTVGTTLEITFSGNILDNAAIDAFNDNRTTEIRLNRWYRQDPHGTEPDYLEQTDWDKMHQVVWDAVREEYVVKYDPVRNSLMTIADSRFLSSHTAFTIFKKEGDLGGGTDRATIYEPVDNGPGRRFGAYLGYLNDTISNSLDLQIWGTSVRTEEVPISDVTKWSNLNTHVFSGLDPVTDTLTIFRQNGIQFGANQYVKGAIETGLSLGKINTLSNYYSAPILLKGVIIYDDYLNEAIVDDINYDLNFDYIDIGIKGVVTYGPEHPNAGDVIPNARVFYYAADDDSLLNKTLIEEQVTGADGRHQLTVEPPAGKVLAYSTHYKDTSGATTRYFSSPVKIPNSYINP